MIVEIGHFALVLALFVSLVQGTVPLIGAARGDSAWMALARPASVVLLVLVGLAFGSLINAYVVSDFSVLNVIDNSHSTMPVIYRIAAVWGNHEGSMLLWVLILALFGTSVALFGRNLPPMLRTRALAVQGLIACAFLLFILTTSDPFTRVAEAPADGQGFNPLLQDPGLALHPPFLYLGYVGFSIAFSFAVAALIEGRVDAAWARWVRPWTLAAWTLLTAGIGLGSWWAYYELGWGGWWYWDPVENASFMPWLAGTALLHSAVVVEKRDTLKGWTVFLAIVTFSLSLLGTFLVRSGVLTSVHAFATDPARGAFILVLLLVAVGSSFALFAWRGPALAPGGLFRPVSREGALLLNNLLLTTAAAVVLLGTLYPLFLEVVGGDKVSVGPPFFDAVFVPLMVPLIVAVAVGALLPWKRGDLAGALGRLKLAFAAAAVVAFGTWFWIDRTAVLAAMGIGLAAWLAVGVAVEVAGRIRLLRVPLADSLRRLRGLPRATWGMSLAHFGLAVLIAGVTASSVWKVEKIQVMKPGDTVAVAGYSFRLDGARQVKGPNYFATRGHFTVTRGGSPVVVLEPEKRLYTVQQRPTTEAAIHSTVFGDLYAVIGDPEGKDGGFVTRLYFNPLVPWIWVGVLLMVAGGLVSLSDRRHRIGAPGRRRLSADATAAKA